MDPRPSLPYRVSQHFPAYSHTFRSLADAHVVARTRALTVDSPARVEQRDAESGDGWSVVATYDRSPDGGLRRTSRDAAAPDGWAVRYP